MNMQHYSKLGLISKLDIDMEIVLLAAIVEINFMHLYLSCIPLNAL